MKTDELSWTPTDPSEIGNLLEEKAKALQEFLSATESLQDRLDAKDIAGVEQVLKRRQGLIDSIDQIDEKISPLLKRPPFGEKNFSPPAKDRLSSLSQTMRDLLTKAEGLDKKCLAQVKFLLKETKEESLRIREGWRVAHRYLKRGNFQPRFMDVRK